MRLTHATHPHQRHTDEQLKEAAAKLTGDIQQVPPMFSALHVDVSGGKGSRVCRATGPGCVGFLVSATQRQRGSAGGTAIIPALWCTH
jgi:hypothetical protein